MEKIMKELIFRVPKPVRKRLWKAAKAAGTTFVKILVMAD